jgi:hypothetical protein
MTEKYLREINAASSAESPVSNRSDGVRTRFAGVDDRGTELLSAAAERPSLIGSIRRRAAAPSIEALS